MAYKTQRLKELEINLNKLQMLKISNKERSAKLDLSIDQYKLVIQKEKDRIVMLDLDKTK